MYKMYTGVHAVSEEGFNQGKYAEMHITMIAPYTCVKLAVIRKLYLTMYVKLNRRIRCRYDKGVDYFENRTSRAFQLKTIEKM